MTLNVHIYFNGSTVPFNVYYNTQSTSQYHHAIHDNDNESEFSNSVLSWSSNHL